MTVHFNINSKTILCLYILHSTSLHMMYQEIKICYVLNASNNKATLASYNRTASCNKMVPCN